MISVIIPVFNEKDTIIDVVRKVQANDFDKEILIVDDGSTDGTREILKKSDDPNVKVIFHPENRGKGAAVKTGFENSRGDIIIIQDADLELDPGEHGILLEPILSGKTDVVFGSRFSNKSIRVTPLWHRGINYILTLLSNITLGINLTDMATCYKVFKRGVVDSFELEEDGFGVDAEITAKIARGNWRIFEVGISYYGNRGRKGGKKIGWRDGIKIVWCIFKYSGLWPGILGGIFGWKGKFHFQR